MKSIRRFLTFLTFCLNAPGPLSADQPDSGTRPNVIIILADDLGFGDLSCYGQTSFSTPNLDQLASEGIRFTQFYAGSTVCAPSRACLFTGQHTGHVYQRFNGKVQFREDPLDLTLARRLSDAGYETAMIGKSGLACNSQDGGLPNRKGFGHFFGFTAHEAAHRYFPKELWRNGELVRYPGNHGKSGQEYSGDLFLNETVEWIKTHGNGPFFLHLSLQQPHADLAAPKHYVDRFRGNFEEVPFPEGNHYRANDFPLATFAGMVTCLDDYVGQVMQTLQELGIEQNTLVMFSSDNGPHREGGMNPLAFASSGGLRGCKRDLYEGGIRVPFVVRWSGRIASGRTSDFQGAFWDIAPTICELAGVPDMPDTDGISFARTLLDDEGNQRQHEYLYWEFHEQGGKQAVRWGDWKGIRLDNQNPEKTRFELYDLSQDPAEQHNVAAQHPVVVNRIKGMMADEHVPTQRVELVRGVLGNPDDDQ